MKNYFIIPALAALLCACSGKSDLSTPEKFTDQLVAAINDRDTVLFNDLYVKNDDMNELMKKGKSQAPQLTQMEEEAKNRMLQDVVSEQETSYGNLAEDITKISTFQLNLYEIENDEGVSRIRNLEVEIETPEHKKKIIRIPLLVKCGTKWKSFGPITSDDVYLN